MDGMAVSLPRRRSRNLEWWAGGFVGCFLLFASISKAWGVREFAVVVAHLLHTRPTDVITFVAAALVIRLEALVAVRLICAPPSRSLTGFVCVLMVLLTAALVALAIDPAAPGCGCFGTSRRASASEDAMIGMLRNVAIIGVLLWVRGKGRSQHPKPRPILVREPASGFTLVELLACIVVIAVLVGLTIPALAGVRARASESRSLSLHRQAGVAVALYNRDYTDHFPYFMTPGRPDGPKVLNGFDVPRAYFVAGRSFWTNLIVPQYFEDAATIDDLSSAERVVWNTTHNYPSGFIASRILLTETCFASAVFWSERSDPTQASLFIGATLGDVLLPSAKGLTVDATIGALSRVPNGTRGVPQLSVGRGDGSSAFVRWSQFGHDAAVSRPHGASGLPVLSTRWGLSGRDF